MRFPQRILMVTAHPDDESFLAGGLLVKNAAAGGSNFLLCATLGERGRAHVEKEYTDSELQGLRKQELTAACGVLGVKDILLETYSDGQLSESFDAFCTSISNAIRQLQPNAVVGFGPDGYTGHADHIAAYKAGLAAAKDHKLPYVAAALPANQDMRVVFVESLGRKRVSETYVDGIKIPYADTVVAIDGKTKLAALHCHLSQWKGLDPYAIFPKEAAEHFLQFEYFVTLN